MKRLVLMLIVLFSLAGLFATPVSSYDAVVREITNYLPAYPKTPILVLVEGEDSDAFRKTLGDDIRTQYTERRGKTCYETTPEVVQSLCTSLSYGVSEDEILESFLAHGYENGCFISVRYIGDECILDLSFVGDGFYVPKRTAMYHYPKDVLREPETVVQDSRPEEEVPFVKETNQKRNGVGFRVGYIYCDSRFSRDVYEYGWEETPVEHGFGHMDMTIGVSGVKNLVDRLSLQMEAAYFNNRYDSFRYTSFDYPVMLRYQVLEKFPRFAVYGGFYPSFIASQMYLITPLYDGGGYATISQNVIYGVAAGADVEFCLGNVGLVLDGRYYRDFEEVHVEADLDGGTNPMNAFLRKGYTVSLGIRVWGE